MGEVLVLTVTAQRVQTKTQKVDRQESEQDEHCGSSGIVVNQRVTSGGGQSEKSSVWG